MRKKITYFLFAFALAALMPLGARAEVYSGGDGWSVTFNGKKMTSTFKSADIDDKIYQLQPGDTVEFHLNLKNSDSNTTEWYMSNSVLKSLEDTQSSASGGAYTYVLSYKAPDGAEEVLYSSEGIGGDLPNGEDGLHKATESLDDFFYLDQLKAGQSAGVDLSVHLEGETQGNGYQDTLAKLQMNFAVETVKTTPPSSRVVRTKIIRTGDQSKTLLFSVLALAGGIGCLAAAIVKLKKDPSERRPRSKRRPKA